MKKLIAASLLASISALPVFAEKPSFSFIEGGYHTSDDTDGFKLRGNHEFTPNFFLNADYRMIKDNVDDADNDFLQLGIGYKFETSSNTSVYTMLNYVDFDSTSSGDSGLGTPVKTSVGDDGFQLGAGVRIQLSNLTQVYGEISTYDFDRTQSFTVLSLGVRQNIADNFGAYAEYNRDDFGGDEFGVGVSLKF